MQWYITCITTEKHLEHRVKWSIELCQKNFLERTLETHQKAEKKKQGCVKSSEWQQGGSTTS